MCIAWVYRSPEATERRASRSRARESVDGPVGLELTRRGRRSAQTAEAQAERARRAFRDSSHVFDARYNYFFYIAEGEAVTDL
jgi:hypothetical protein